MKRLLFTLVASLALALPLSASAKKPKDAKLKEAVSIEFVDLGPGSGTCFQGNCCWQGNLFDQIEVTFNGGLTWTRYQCLLVGGNYAWVSV